MDAANLRRASNALAESRRVLRAGGRLAPAVFAGPEDTPWPALPTRAVVEGGQVPPPDPTAGGRLVLPALALAASASVPAA